MARLEPRPGERPIDLLAVPASTGALCKLCGAGDLRSSLQCQSHRLDAVLRRHHDLQPAGPAELRLRRDSLHARGRMLPDRRVRRRVWHYCGLHDLPAVPLVALPAVCALSDLSRGVLRAAGAGLRVRLLHSAGLLRVPDVFDLGLFLAGVLDVFLVLVLRELCGRGLHNLRRLCGSGLRRLRGARLQRLRGAGL